jgi:hypothetical protein
VALPRTWRRPSLARTGIEKYAPPHTIDRTSDGSWQSSHLDTVKFLLEVVSNVDEGILFATFSPEQGLKWRRHLAAVQGAVRRWQSGGEGHLPFSYMGELYALLKLCPDEVVPKAARQLPFIGDDKLRESIARDIDSLEALVRDEEWKAATIIGGSVVEALLLDRLLDAGNAASAKAAEAAHVVAKDKGWPRVEDAEDWKLWKLIVVAKELKLISETVANVCDAARDFRNLIHPSKERAEAPCDRGTALAAVAAVENLVLTFNGSRLP